MDEEDLRKELKALREEVDYLHVSRPLGCYDCGRRYEKGPDLHVPNEDWEKISPRQGGAGVLCPNCMHDRFVALGFNNGSVRAQFKSGPFAAPIAICPFCKTDSLVIDSFSDAPDDYFIKCQSCDAQAFVASWKEPWGS